MEDISTALLERFSKHLEKLNKLLENLKNLDASLKRTYPLPRVTPTSLLDLPFEIRLQIYCYCIPRKCIIGVSHPRFPIGWPLEQEGDTLDFEGDYWNLNKNKNSLLLLSKQLSEECLDILYGENISKLYCRLAGDLIFRRGQFSIESGYWDDYDDGPVNSRDV